MFLSQCVSGFPLGAPVSPITQKHVQWVSLLPSDSDHQSGSQDGSLRAVRQRLTAPYGLPQWHQMMGQMQRMK